MSQSDQELNSVSGREEDDGSTAVRSGTSSAAAVGGIDGSGCGGDESDHVSQVVSMAGDGDGIGTTTTTTSGDSVGGAISYDSTTRIPLQFAGEKYMDII